MLIGIPFTSLKKKILQNEEIIRTTFMFYWLEIAKSNRTQIKFLPTPKLVIYDSSIH